MDSGHGLTLETARLLVTSAVDAAKQDNLQISVAVVDASAQLIAFERMDNAQLASVKISQDKAISAAAWKCSTKGFEESLASGGLNWRLLSFSYVVPVEGGLPVFRDQQMVGAIGISGASSEQDGQIAQLAIARTVAP